MKTQYISVRMTEKQWWAVLGCIAAAVSGGPEDEAFLGDDSTPEQEIKRAERAQEIISDAIVRKQ